MKKIIVNGLCATVVCFFLSSFSANSNNLGNNASGISSYSPLQDTTHKKMGKKKWDKSDSSKMKKSKTPSK